MITVMFMYLKLSKMLLGLHNMPITKRYTKFKKYDQIIDDCGIVYCVDKVGCKYYHLNCIHGNGLSGVYDINDIDCEFRMESGKQA